MRLHLLHAVVLACILHEPCEAWALGHDLAPHDGPQQALLQRLGEGLTIINDERFRYILVIVCDELRVLCRRAPVIDGPDRLVKVAGGER